MFHVKVTPEDNAKGFSEGTESHSSESAEL